VGGKPGKVIFSARRTEVIQHQERVKLGHLGIAKGPFEVDTGPLDGRLPLPYLLDLAD
jgi:hypothetical protein